MKTNIKTLFSRTPLKDKASVFFGKNGFGECHKISAPQTNIRLSFCCSFAASEALLSLQISLPEPECPSPLLELLAGAMLAIFFYGIQVAEPNSCRTFCIGMLGFSPRCQGLGNSVAGEPLERSSWPTATLMMRM